ncbi:hypothetical protein Syun_008047 [Stephania yunnanensis]|uniref:DUF4378 domain-containing protein n=1 Tax=Stephania yunnanensis TaxID=152371 RepID=A0AAP0KZQ1_9MAGN
MGTEKQGSKSGGGYVGGFRQLFDWNGKSRKKLFSSKSDLPVECYFLSTEFSIQIEEDDDKGNISVKGSGSYSCSSSVTDDEGNGTKAPGVVARLMGLDSLPTFNSTEPYSTPFFSSRTLHERQHRRNPDFFNEYKSMYSSNQLTRSNDFPGNTIDLKVRKAINRPIQRFQTEILPPKSAKSIPVTHHKLLSPIKSPMFIQSKNAAQIMEEAAKIIVLGSQVNVKGRVTSAGSSSFPVKFQNVKKRLEAVQKSSNLHESNRGAVESKAVNYLKGQSLNKSWNGVQDEHAFTGSASREGSNSTSLKNNKKSVSLAIQAKVNVQRREGMNSSSNKNMLNQKEQNEFQLNLPFKSQPGTQKNIQKKSMNQNAAGVLRLNNHKQNRLTSRDKTTLKPPVPRQRGKKPVPDSASSVQHKNLNKVTESSKFGSRKIGIDTKDDEKEEVLSRGKNLRQKKRSIDGDLHPDGTNDVLVGKSTKSNHLNTAIDGAMPLEAESKRKCMDVVSFTFTSPLARSMPMTQTTTQTMGNHNRIHVDSCSEHTPAQSSKSSFLGLNAIRGDALSVLLEQKLRELTYGIESSSHKSVRSVCAASSSSLVSDLSALNSNPEEYDKTPQLKFNSTDFSNCSSSEGFMLEGEEELDDYSSKRADRKEVDCWQPSPVSILEPSFSNETVNSSDSSDYNCMNGENQCLSIQTQELVDLNCPAKLPSNEVDTELSDSASSLLIEDPCRDHVKASNRANSIRLDNWELEYVREILCAELLFEDFTVSEENHVIKLVVFDELENQKTSSIIDSEENNSTLRRKVLFDCVDEHLHLRCRKYCSGGYKAWGKGVEMVNNGWLAEEVYKEISGFRGVVIDDSTLDELVDRDMSSQYGKWLDFEIERFEAGVEIARRILSSLVNEAVKDMISG